MKTQQDWQELVFSSHYLTAAAIKTELQDGNVEAAMLGTTELMEAMSKIDRRAVKSHLAVLMMHIIKWKTQPHKRSNSWLQTIDNARDEIRDIQEDTPSITDNVIREAWDTAFKRALRNAEREMGEKSHAVSLTWQEVFDDEYFLPRLNTISFSTTMKTHQDWQELASTSHYQTAFEVRQELYAGNMQEAIAGVTELIDALTRSDKRALKAQVSRLMKHIIKWNTAPQYRTVACSLSILDARREINYLLEDTPSLAKGDIQNFWQAALEAASIEAEIETGIELPPIRLSWAQVFEDKYSQKILAHAE